MAELYDIFSGEKIERSHVNNEFISEITPFIVNTYDDLCLAAEHQAILARHLSDTTIVTNRVGEDGVSELCVKKIDENDCFQRLLILNPQDLIYKSIALRKASKLQNIEIDKTKSERLALDWVVFELSFNAASNSVYMQHNYAGYVRDFDGQGGSYRSQYTIPRLFFDKNEISPSFKELHAEYIGMLSGIALEMMKDRLITYRVVDSIKQSEWIIEALRKNYQHNGNHQVSSVSPHSRLEISQRLAGVDVKDTLREIAKWTLALYGPDVDIDNTDYVSPLDN